MQRLSTGMNHARALEKIVCPKGREKTRASPRWENVIWACQVISQGGRRVRANKDGPRIANRRQPLVGPSHQQLHVLRRYRIGNLNAFTEPPGNDNRSVSLQGLDGNRAPSGPLELLSQRRLDPARQRKRGSNAKRRCKLIVFSLREHIRGHVRRIRMGISQEENLARPRNGIDIHLSENHTLGCGDIDISGSDNLIDPRDRFRAKGHCRDCLGAADPKEPVHTGEPRRGQNNRPIFSNRRGHHDFPNTRDLRGDNVHKNR